MSESKTTGAVTLVDCGCRAEAYNDGSGIELYYCDQHAAAPDLYEALKAVMLTLQNVRDHAPDEWDALLRSGWAVALMQRWDEAKAALQKAEGKP